MRQHKTLESMIESAEKWGRSRRRNWAVYYDVEPLHSQTNVSFKYVEDLEAQYMIQHYGVTVLTLVRRGNLYTGHQYDVKYVYGESRSDADAINAVLEYFGIRRYKASYRPVNGGFVFYQLSDNKELSLPYLD
jgi:hypothetical protein